MDAATAYDWQTRRVKNWLLAVLRFSVTFEGEDRSDVMARADDIDRLGFVARKPEFSFFLRTSIELCDAIENLAYAGRHEVLRRHLARIDDPRLRRAFSAAVVLEQREAPKPTFHADSARVARKSVDQDCS
jgi:hypothetical protein